MVGLIQVELIFMFTDFTADSANTEVDVDRLRGSIIVDRNTDFGRGSRERKSLFDCIFVSIYFDISFDLKLSQESRLRPKTMSSVVKTFDLKIYSFI